jgi:S-phase kinase-associated protein 1
MNNTLKDLTFDCLQVTNVDELNEILQKKIEQKSDWYFNIPLGEEFANLIELMLSFSKYHSEVLEFDEDNLSKWDLDFIENIKTQKTMDTIYELFTFADYLHNERLMTVCAIYIAQNDIAKLTTQQLRKKFNIKNDLTKEEEDQIDEETKWIKQYEQK